MRNNKYNMKIYTGIWIVAIFILFISLFQNIGDAKIINYSGIVRGATQKLIKKELYGNPDDSLISYLDDILNELQTGEGKYDLILMNDYLYQSQLSEMSEVWEDIKIEINHIRNGESKDKLFALSEDYFQKANQMVATAEYVSNQKLTLSIVIFLGYLLITIGVFGFWHKYKQKQLDKARYVDDLTGLHNFQAFEIEVQKQLINKTKKFVMLCFDIDDFKYLNSTYGYQFGDRLLIVIANFIQALTYEKGTCARYGNDQFFVLIEDEEHIIQTIKKYLKEDIKKNIEFDISDDLTICIGAYKVKSSDSVKACIDNTSLAHKTAKKKGQDTVVWHNQDLLDKIYRENKIVKRMHNGIVHNEFKVYLQPKFEIPSLHVVGAEALVRWHMEDGSILYPDEFISLFEQNGFIYELDFYMLEQVCQFIKEQHLEQNFRISINFSRVSIHHKDFYDDLTCMIQKYKIPLQSLEIEITESAFNELSSFTINILNKLHRDGFILSMDDFGAGYSSLNSLNTIPVDFIKIDREFLRRKESSLSMVSVIECIIKISHALGKYVIAEGVETKKDVDLLNQLDCHLGQGYYVSQPIIKEEFVKKFLDQ